MKASCSACRLEFDDAPPGSVCPVCHRQILTVAESELPPLPPVAPPDRQRLQPQERAARRIRSAERASSILYAFIVVSFLALLLSIVLGAPGAVEKDSWAGLLSFMAGCLWSAFAFGVLYLLSEIRVIVLQILLGLADGSTRR